MHAYEGCSQGNRLCDRHLKCDRHAHIHAHTCSHLCSTFADNAGANGILNMGYVQMNFTGRNIFLQNSGNSLRVSNAMYALYHYVNTFVSIMLVALCY